MASLLLRRARLPMMGIVPQSVRQLAASKGVEPPSICQAPLALFEYLMEHSDRRTSEQIALQKQVDDGRSAVMAGSPDQAAFFKLFLQAMQAKRVVEVGVFRGSTTLAMALADSVHHVVALDVSSEYPSTARPHWEQAGVAHKIDLRIGPALDALDGMVRNGEAGSYDFAFIDADKANYDAYYERCLQLVRTGGVVAVDNVLWHGAVLDQDARVNERSTSSIHNLNVKILQDERVDMSMLSLADGCTLCYKK
eukprot:TRINITY_DN7308_c0_g1_i5.p1 TRINITY_DN7308_c0_g1~~TRINITY_DN7308_c0_g1_i5.p1  ORF type:complete len:252 (+),score=50.14 TRINITY_DN7308_c0_g1_i5:233-988(+)